MAGQDPRSRALLLRALKTDDDTLVHTAFIGLAEQRDLESLPFLESVMRRSDDPSILVDLLTLFQSERADAVAMKFMEDESQLERYREMRDGLGFGVR